MRFWDVWGQKGIAQRPAGPLEEVPGEARCSAGGRVPARACDAPHPPLAGHNAVKCVKLPTGKRQQAVMRTTRALSRAYRSWAGSARALTTDAVAVPLVQQVWAGCGGTAAAARVHTQSHGTLKRGPGLGPA